MRLTIHSCPVCVSLEEKLKGTAKEYMQARNDLQAFMPNDARRTETERLIQQKHVVMTEIANVLIDHSEQAHP